MDNKSYDQLLITQATIGANSQDYEDKTKKLTADIIGMIASMMDNINFQKSSPYKKYSTMAQDPTNLVPDNKKALLLGGENSKKDGGIWTHKHELSSPRLYELLSKT